MTQACLTTSEWNCKQETTDASDTDTSADITAALIGTWMRTSSSDNKDEYVMFNDDGTLEIRKTDDNGVEVARTEGTYSVDGNNMTMSLSDGTVFDTITVTVDDDTLTLESPDYPDGTLVYTRQDETVVDESVVDEPVVDESAPATPLSADPASALIGTWTGIDASNITYLTLNADGTMDVLLLDPSGVEVNRLHYTYTVEGDEMVWTMDSQSARISYTLDGDTLTFIEPGHSDQPLILTRSDAYVEADYTPADLAGTWVAYSNGEQGFFTDDYKILDLYWSISEDGTLESYGVDSNGAEYDRRPNTYTISGNALTVTGSSGEPATYYIRIDGDTMTLGGIGANDSYWIFTRIS